MSEFSDSFHLQTSDPQEVIALLRRASVGGAILPVEGPFTAFIATYEDDPKIIEHNTGLLIRYQFAKDYGCWVDVYEGSLRIAQLVYEDEQAKEEVPDDTPIEEPQDRNEAIAALLRAHLIDPAAVITLRALDELKPRREWGPTVAQILRIRPVEWISGRDLAHKEQLLDVFPNARILDASCSHCRPTQSTS